MGTFFVAVLSQDLDTTAERAREREIRRAEEQADAMRWPPFCHSLVRAFWHALCHEGRDDEKNPAGLGCYTITKLHTSQKDAEVSALRCCTVHVQNDLLRRDLRLFLKGTVRRRLALLLAPLFTIQFSGEPRRSSLRGRWGGPPKCFGMPIDMRIIE